MTGATSIGWRDPRKRPGELLWPARFPASEVAAMKERLGPYGYAGQAQQRPVPAGGGMLKREWWKFYGELPEGYSYIITSWDFTFKKTDSGSYVCGQAWARIKASFYALDQVRGRWDYPTMKAAMVAFARKHSRANAHVVEERANGPAIIADLKDKVSGIIPWPPPGERMASKEARAAAISPTVAAGNAFLPDGAAWVSDFLSEWETFPRGYDDQVDTTSQAIEYLRRHGGSDGDPKFATEEETPREAAW